MKNNFRATFTGIYRVLGKWYVPAGITVLLLGALAYWVWPQRYDTLVTPDGKQRWQASDGPPVRQVLWESPSRIDDLLPEQKGKGSFISPRLADNGATLYFTFRPHKGQADIYRSRFLHGEWQKAEPVDELNTEADDIGPVISRDGKELYFYSNRPGGLGGSDLYLANWTGKAWSEPRNLGAGVNSPAQEFDPALAPDGLTLFFSSNRTAEMAKPVEGNGDPWQATLRGQPGLTQFDLYLVERPGNDQPWTTPQALADINLPTSHEGAPYVSRAGEFLYFASDRPSRKEEARNFDLYRARWGEGGFFDIENLGPGINTAANETEPGLTPEGFGLFFSSDRDRGYDLYQTTAREVYPRTQWDTSRLAALGALWWKILIFAGLLSLLLWLTARYREWLFDKATAARFFWASLVVHFFVLLLVGVVPLAQEIAERAKEMQMAQSPQIFESDAKGQSPFDQVVDPGEISASPMTDLDRAKTALPEASDLPLPKFDAKFPLTEPRPVPLKELVEPETSPKRIELARKTISPPVLIESAPALPDPLPSIVRPNEPAPREPKVALLRKETEPVRDPLLELPRRKLKAPALPDAVNSNSRDLPKTTPLAESPLAAKRKPVAPSQAIETALPSVDPTPAKIKTKSSEFAEPTVTLPRRDTAGKPDLAMLPSPVAAKPSPGRPTREIVEKPAESSLETAALPDPLAKMRNKRRPVIAESPTVPTETVVASRPTPMPTEKLMTSVDVALDRPMSSLPDIPLERFVQPSVPGETSFPAARLKMPGDAKMQGGDGPATPKLPRRPASGMRLARVETPIDAYSLRATDLRKKNIEKLGGSTASEVAVERGLDWMAAHQDGDGHWSVDNFHQNCKHPRCTAPATIHADAAGTGLALLPFFAAGYTHQDGKHQATVAKGLRWLLKNQRPDGNLTGSGEYRILYGQGIAAIALCEAYAMTRDPELREPAQRAINFIVNAQHGPSGGWRYTPNSSGDTSVLGWQVMALKSAEMAGLKVPPKTWDGARRWLKSVEGKNANRGRFGYQNANPTPAMTAQGLLCLQLMGAERGDPRMRAGADFLIKNLPQRGKETSYYWYHAIQVMYSYGGDHWKAWNEPLRDMLVSTQVIKGSAAGSWDPIDPRETTGGRLYATSLRLLMLEVYYRRLPLYRKLEN